MVGISFNCAQSGSAASNKARGGILMEGSGMCLHDALKEKIVPGGKGALDFAWRLLKNRGPSSTPKNRDSFSCFFIRENPCPSVAEEVFAVNFFFIPVHRRVEKLFEPRIHADSHG